MKKTVLCFGEVLFDAFPTYKKIGGAPLNVALRLASLGINAQIISRIGNDASGKELLAFIEASNISTETLQIDQSLSTGEVLVQLDNQGSATYSINYPVAWDNIELTSLTCNATRNAEVFVFSSLVCRDERSYNSLQKLLKIANYKIFDVNLRAPFYSKELLINLIQQADFLKFNDDELYEISGYLKSPYASLEENIVFIAERTQTKSICVTKGRHGALHYYNQQFYFNNGYEVIVADTVGAGDSFLAGLISQLIDHVEPQQALNFACALGAMVASHEGANPKISNDSITKLMQLD
ncbi:MAG: carbohydrate kinase [Methylococcales bacterium]|nr:MAG: carbohydrate kinase [Methylococcales bacterium]